MKIESINNSKKIYDLDQIKLIVAEIKKNGKTISLCHGVFDLLHPGHVQHFKEASNLSDYLFVSITADQYVNKGPGRPLFEQQIRAQTLAALEVIDFVVISDSTTAVTVIENISPDYYVKGSDYKNSDDDVTGNIDKEQKAVEDKNGKLYFTSGLTSSSSMLINKFFTTANQGTKNWIDKFNAEYGYKSVAKYLEKVSKLNVLALGETIIDQYTSCTTLAKSSKDPILAFHKLSTSYFPGGILAIANNSGSWTNHVKVISFVAPRDFNIQSFESSKNKNISTVFYEAKDRPTILKHRFVETGSSTRVFEYYDFSDLDMPQDYSDKMIEIINSSVASYDLIVAADYGHGFFTKEVIKSIEDSEIFLAVNTQANAGNRGYNTISKYAKADLISLNGAELQLELRNHKPDYLEIVPKLIKNMSAKFAVVTLGAEGLIVFDNQGNFEKAPALAQKLVDKVGAGDSVFAIASLLAKVNAPLPVIGFLANLVAAHEVSQLGHQRSLSNSDLLKHTKSVLG